MASLVRPREAARSVAPIELFFDLVYVFTVSQLSSSLIHDVSLRGIVETLVLTLAVMYAWFMTVWTSNWLDVERRPVQLMLLGLMFATLLMATSVTYAFGDLYGFGGDRAGLFVIGYLAIQVGRTLFAVAAFRGHRLHRHFVNALAWEVGTGLVWIAGVFADGDARLAIWALAVVLTYAGVIAGHPLPGHRSPFSSDSQIYAEHLLERFRLFFLIALGETVLTIGKAFVEVPVDAGRLVALAASFVGTVSLWWCYFHRSERVGIDAVRGGGDGSRLVAFGNYTLVAMVIGIVGIAVGDELAIADPGFEGATTAMYALIFGGPAIFLLAQLAFFHQATGVVSQSRIVACIALAALAFATAGHPLLTAVIAASLVLLAVAVADTRAEVPSTATL
ncbi:MAG TPA: low temperature requirement protein A [Solirubrobacterales bacterium]|nr:low temperature requirement protein A [Solirubrobacterales bacterium]